MTPRVHNIEQHRSVVPGVDALTLITNSQFPRHFHDQFGFGVMTFGGHRSWSGIGTVEAQPGDLILVNPGETHDGAPLAGQPRGWRMVYLNPGHLAAHLKPAQTRDVVRPVARDPLLAARFATLFAALTSEPADALAAEEQLLLTLRALLRRHGATAPPPPGRVPYVHRALERIQAAPQEPITLAVLARLCGVSRFQLLRGFARATGLTPHAYLIQQRLLLARRLLAQRRSPAEAAAESGFADQAHLTRAFARHYGITPGRYRAAVS